MPRLYTVIPFWQAGASPAHGVAQELHDLHALGQKILHRANSYTNVGPLLDGTAVVQTEDRSVPGTAVQKRRSPNAQLRGARLRRA